MASVSKDAKGYRVLFFTPDGKRKAIRLTGYTKAKAVQVGRHIDELVTARTSAQPVDRQTALWLSDIGEKLHAKLLNAGLVEERDSTAEHEQLFLEFVDDFIKEGKTAQGNKAANQTVAKWKTVRSHLKPHFKERTLKSLTPVDARKFREALQTHRFARTEDNPDGRPLTENAIRKIIGNTKVMLNSAKRLGLIDRNPFEFEVSSVRPNRSRDFYVTPKMAEQILEACPDAQWRLMFALWRLAGLRKMEIFALRWEHVLWDRGRILVTSSKTAHHEGKGCRFVPFGAILPYLEAVFDEAASADRPVITRFSRSNSNLDKPMKRIVERAGLKPWPKLFQNLRASCETEWLDSGLPAHVVANWMGHSVKVQNDNYAQVDDHHFERFNAATEKVAHQVAQYGSEPNQIEPNTIQRATEKPALFRGDSSELPSRRIARVLPQGLEP